ncbi:MAG: hypothetical protein SFX73_27520 [Kofleriaceae bacterium]|nr:hypothetical protein [Kofleriaceae bacterium]
MRFRARRDCLAMTPSLDETDNRIIDRIAGLTRHGLDSSCLHSTPHVRLARHFVTADLQVLACRDAQHRPKGGA